VGWYSDRMDGGRIRLVAAMAGIGAVGYAMLAAMDVPAFLVVGVVLAFAAGWGYNGLFISAVVALHPDTPASATGVTQAGAFGGAVVGPPIFGAVASATSYPAAWLLLALFGVGTAALFTTAQRRVLSERAVAASS
jgi:MFS family permease